MRMLVTGREGQVAQALAELGPGLGIEVVRIGRPVLDLAVPESIGPAIIEARPDVVVGAAAYTAVDKAESEADRAFAINTGGAGSVAAAAAALGVPVIHLSTDYVFDGAADRPYVEDDPTGPLGVYGASKLGGEAAVARNNPRHVILRTAWVYGPFGGNFVRTMLRVAGGRDEVSVVADQRGRPTAALDIAAAIAVVAQRLTGVQASDDLVGLFHLTAQGDAVWADLAETVFAVSAEHGGPAARVRRIGTADYPTAARRPMNSRLDGGKLARVYGITLPHWRTSVRTCVTRLLADVPAARYYGANATS